MGGYEKKKDSDDSGTRKKWWELNLFHTPVDRILQQDMGRGLWNYNAEKEAIKQEGHPDTQDLCIT